MYIEIRVQWTITTLLTVITSEITIIYTLLFTVVVVVYPSETYEFSDLHRTASSTTGGWSCSNI